MYSIKRLVLGSAVLGLLCMSLNVNARDVTSSDKRFLKNAAESGNYEVEGSQLALKKIEGCRHLEVCKNDD